MAEDPQSTLRVNADTSGAKNEIKGLGGIFGGLFGTIAGGVATGNLLFGAITGVVGAIGSLGRAALGFISSSMQMNATLESTTLQFATLMGNADAAKGHVQGLFEFAKKTPFETGPIIQASKHFEIFGGAALNTQKNLTLVGDAAAATNAPINEIAMWTGRLYAALQAGKPFGEAAMRLGELGVMGPKTRDQLERLQKTGASGAEVFTAYQESLGKFTGAMEKQQNTWGGLTSSISDTISILSATAFAPFFDMAKAGLSTVLDLLGSQGMTNAAAGMGKAFGDAFQIIRAAFGPVISGFISTAKGASAAADGSAFFGTVVKALIGIVATFMQVLSGIVRAIATVIQAYFEFRIAGNLLLIAFGKIVEGILWGTLKIAEGMAKVSFGETRKSFERDAESLRGALTKVQTDVSGLTKDTEAYRAKSEATGRTLRVFADQLDNAAKETMKQGAAYKYVAPVTQDFSNIVREVGENSEETTTKQTKLQKATETFGKSMVDLDTKILNAQRSGKSMDEIIKLFGNDVKTATEKADEFGLRVPKSFDMVSAGVARAKRAIETAKFDEAYRKAMGEIEQINQQEWERVAKDTEAGVKKAGESFKNMVGIVEKANDDAALAQKKGLDKQLAQIDIKHREEIQKLGTLPPEYARVYALATKNVDEKYAQMGRVREDKMAKEIADLAKIGPTYGEEYERAKNKIAEKYRIMAALAEKRKIEEIAGLGPIPEEYRKAYDAAVAAINGSYGKIKQQAVRDDQKKTRDEWIKGVDEMAKSIADLAQITGGSFGKIAGAAGTLVGSFSTVMKSVDGVKAGAAALSAGNILSGISSMATGIGGIITAASAAFGALKKLFEGKPDWQKIGSEINRDYGINVSDALAKQIEATAKTVKDRNTAILLNLSSVIKEAGGITVQNIDLYTKKTHDLFSAVEQRKITLEQAMKSFNEVFPQLAKTITESNGLANQSFLDLIATQERFGGNSKEVLAFVTSQIKSATAGMKAFLDNAIISSQETASSMGTAAAAMFEKLRADGATTADALKTMGPVIAGLEAQFKTTGFTGGAAFDQIKALAATASNEIVAKAMTAVDGLNATMRGLHNSGLMNQDMFSGLSRQVSDTFNRLVAEGHNGDHVLQLMRPTLQTLHEMQRNFGYQTDDSTQALLDQARASGQVGDQYMSAQDRMAAATDRVANAIEFMAQKMGYLPQVADHVSRSVGGAFQNVERQVYSSGDAFSRWRDYAVDAADDVYDAVDRVSFGASPGGLKEWVPMLKNAAGAFGEVSNRGVSQIERLKREVNAFGMQTPGIGLDVASGRSPLLGGGKVVHVHMENSTIAGVEGLNAFVQTVKGKIADDQFRTQKMEVR